MELPSGIGVLLLALACPIGMVAMMGAPWLVAKARGEKRALSMHCMPGDHEARSQAEDQVVREPR